MNQAASRRLRARERPAPRASPNDELRVHYQPIVDGGERHASPRTRRCCAGSTRRAAWSRPAEFIQLAEDTGLILSIGEWVLARGLPLGDLHRRRARPAGQRQSLGAPVQRPEAAPSWWRARCKETGLPPQLLELEITESTAMQQTDARAAHAEAS